MCLFCDIVNKQESAQIEFENDKVIIFKDIHPQARVHVLVVPKIHVANLIDTPDELLLEIMKAARQYILKNHIVDFKLVHNAYEAAEIQHFHLHILGRIKTSLDLA